MAKHWVATFPNIENIGLAKKSSFRFFHTILEKNLNELSGQPNILPITHRRFVSRKYKECINSIIKISRQSSLKMDKKSEQDISLNTLYGWQKST